MKRNAQIDVEEDTFRALASKPRINILKLLVERQLTVTDVSKALKINKSSAYHHLNQLVKASLVKKVNTNSLWVYYKLTVKGKNVILRSNEKKRVLAI